MDYLSLVNDVLQENRRSMMELKECTKKLALTIQTLISHNINLHKEIKNIKIEISELKGGG